MKLFLTCLFVIFATYLGSCKGVSHNLDTYEFGENIGRIVYTAMGVIDDYYWDRTNKTVQIVIPECMELKYVHVDFDSDYDPPSVDFDWKNLVVNMTFDYSQFTATPYVIYAKAVPDIYCAGRRNNGPRLSNLQ